MPESVFLTADWHNLALVNYEVEPDVLTPYVPADDRNRPVGRADAT